MQIKLVRFLDDGEQRAENGIIKGGVVGKLFQVREREDYFLNIFTLERPKTYKGISNFRDDRKTSPNESCCIPDGTYEVVFEYSNRFKRKLFEIKGVPNRSETKFHLGNHIDCSEGCILVGKQFIQRAKDPRSNKVYNLWLSQSAIAERELPNLLPEKFTLTIETDNNGNN